MENETVSNEANAIKLPDMERLLVSSSPHVHGGESVRRIMLLVVLALLPAAAAGVYFFGAHALRVLLLCTFGCLVCESACQRLRGRRSTLGDGSALVTGVLLGMNLSASTPWWICLLGAFIAMVLGKHLYGGLGYNPFNPALVARVALLIAFPGHLTTWVTPRGADGAGRALAGQALEGVSAATPLYAVPQALAETGVAGYEYASYFFGRIGGCIGETSALALLAGGVLLIALKLIRWQIPVAYIGTVFILTGILHQVAPNAHPTPIFHILTGGLMLGAFFMATDMTTTPMTRKGAVIFGIGCGVVTTAIRVWGVYPEGVSFSILFMNALTPLIDRFTTLKPFGAKKV